ncbi:MAG: hypothetical protein AAGF28_08950 [Pseudomonadota bacterium]
MKIAILPLARATFDVEFAQEKFDAMLAALDQTGHEIVGPRELLFDGDAAQAAISSLTGETVDRVLILQVTFTDAAIAVEIANAFAQPLSIWAVPEPRLGGRLRLNAFCGLNLASHALGLANRTFSWAYRDPVLVTGAELEELFSGQNQVSRMDGVPPRSTDTQPGEDIKARLSGRRVARLGERPDGFHTCDYDSKALLELTGVAVDEYGLDRLFDEAKSVPDEEAASLKTAVSENLSGMDAVDPDQLKRSLKLKVALDRISGKSGYDAFAIRCWPETFTEYGGAVCGPVSMMGEARVPCACEADVYGAATQLLLQEVADAPVFLADLVDMDIDDNTGVVWHCGQAPLSMMAGDGEAMATIHTNRKMPLLYEFTLKPGVVTFVRLSQAFGEPKLIIARGEMMDRPMAFTGTSGVVRFDNAASDVLQSVIDSGLEHHMALAYGDHIEALHSVASALSLPVLEL